MRPLVHPPNAERDEDSLEVLRAWIVDGELEIAIVPWAWKDQPKQWGRLLADAAAHMADAIAKETGEERDAVYERIVDSARHYFDHPSPDRQGDFVDDAPQTSN